MVVSVVVVVVNGVVTTTAGDVFLVVVATVVVVVGCGCGFQVHGCSVVVVVVDWIVVGGSVEAG